MHQRVSRALPAAVVGAALAALGPGTGSAALAVLGPGTTGASAAPAAPARAVGAPIYVTDRSGYRAGHGTGWRFRWLTITFTIPSCSAVSTQHGWTGSTVRLGANSKKWQAEFLADCDPGGAGAGAPVTYQLLINGSLTAPADIGLRPLAGHQVTLSMYYSRSAGTVRFVAGDDTAHDAMARTVHVGTGATYYGAGAGSLFSGTISAPPHDIRVGAFSAVHLTSYDGHKGTMLGPWTTNQIIATAGGTASGDLIADAPVLWNGGANFGVWQRTTA